PSFRHTLHQVVPADHVSPGLLRLAGLLAYGEDRDADLFTRAVGQHDRPAHHLLRVARVVPQPDVRLDGGVELRDRRVADHLTCDLGLEPAVAVARDRGLDLLGRLDVLLPSLLRHRSYSTTSRPIERAVPSTIFIAASGSYALRSFCSSSTTWRCCCRVTRPSFSRFGLAAPFSTPAARFSSRTA